MLFKFLDSVRSKPKPVRDQYALGIAIFCTFVIGGVWSLSLPTRFGGDSQVAALASTTKNAAPFANFFVQLKNQFSGVKEAINDLSQATTTAPTTASTTEAALGLQLSDENKQQIKASSTENSGSNIHFGTTTIMSTTTQKQAASTTRATTSTSGGAIR